MDVKDIKSRVSLVEIAGKDTKLSRKGEEYVGLCPLHNEKSPSFTIYPGKDEERFHCFGCGVKGDVVRYIQETRRVDYKEALRILGGQELAPAGQRKALPPRVDKYAGITIRSDAPALQGDPLSVWNPNHKRWETVAYTHAFNYTPSMAVLRIEKDGEKWTPQIVWANTPDGKRGWAYMPFPEPRPLYGFRQDAKQVIVVQGEKKAKQLRDALGGKRCIVSSSGGDNAVSKTDWECLSGKDIIIWPDADDSGRKAALYVAERIGPIASRVRIVGVDDKPKGWDAGDLLTDDPAADVIAFLKERLQDHGSQPPQTALPPPPASAIAAPQDWEAGLTFTKDNKLVPRSQTNMLLMMRYSETFAGIFKYDSFAKRIIVHRCPPWEDERNFHVRKVEDYDAVHMEGALEKYNLKAPKNKCEDLILATSQLPENTFNPAADYFNALQWDGVPRLDTWLMKYVANRHSPHFGLQSEEYLRVVGRKFLCGLAARAMKPGVKFDTMVILEGPQYAGKSYISKLLATINGVPYFLDDVKDITNKDTLMEIQGKLIVEFAEISAMRKAEINELKGFLSRTVDVYRPPYGRHTKEAGRQCVFIGTVNPEGPYLRDVTGNRRYWPVSCRKKLDLEAIAEVVPLLHAEAAHCVRQGEQLWLTDEEYKIASIEQTKRVVEDVWTDRLESIVTGLVEITTDEILSEMQIPVERRTPQIHSRINQTMITLGWHPARLTSGHKRPRGFRRDDQIQSTQIPARKGPEEVEIPFNAA